MSIDNIPRITLSKEDVDRALDVLLPITGDLIYQRIVDGIGDFYSITIADQINCFKMDISQSLVFGAVNVGAGIDFRESTLSQLTLRKSDMEYLRLGGAIINSNLVIEDSSINKLMMNDTVINGPLIIRNSSIRDIIELRDTKISGYIKIVTKEAPKEIWVSEDLAQRIHFAAPTVPLIVVKNRG